MLKSKQTQTVNSRGLLSRTPKKKPSPKQILEHLKSKFLYYPDGKPYIYSFGEFKGGLTRDEVLDYLRVRTNRMNVTSVFKKLCKRSIGDTCPLAIVNGVAVPLSYRSDVQRHTENVLEGTPTYFD